MTKIELGVRQMEADVDVSAVQEFDTQAMDKEVNDLVSSDEISGQIDEIKKELKKITLDTFIGTEEQQKAAAIKERGKKLHAMIRDMYSLNEAKDDAGIVAEVSSTTNRIYMGHISIDDQKNKERGWTKDITKLTPQELKEVTDKAIKRTLEEFDGMVETTVQQAIEESVSIGPVTEVITGLQDAIKQQEEQKAEEEKGWFGYLGGFKEKVALRNEEAKKMLPKGFKAKEADDIVIEGGVEKKLGGLRALATNAMVGFKSFFNDALAAIKDVGPFIMNIGSTVKEGRGGLKSGVSSAIGAVKGAAGAAKTAVDVGKGIADKVQ